MTRCVKVQETDAVRLLVSYRLNSLAIQLGGCSFHLPPIATAASFSIPTRPKMDGLPCRKTVESSPHRSLVNTRSTAVRNVIRPCPYSVTISSGSKCESGRRITVAAKGSIGSTTRGTFDVVHLRGTCQRHDPRIRAHPFR